MLPREAYLKAYPTNNPGYANLMSGKLVKTERVKTAMKKELKPFLDKLGIDETYILSGIKDLADFAEKDDVQLKALFKLSDIMDLEDKNRTTVTQVSGALFQGFQDKELLKAERPKELDG